MGDVEIVEVQVETTTGMVVVPPPVESDIYGTVIDAETNLPVSGASVRISETTQGVGADAAGKFFLVPHSKSSFTIEVTSIGYEKQVITINEHTALPVMVLLKPKAKVLDTA